MAGEYNGYNSLEEWLAAMSETYKGDQLDKFYENYLTVPREVKQNLSPTELEQGAMDFAKMKAKRPRLTAALVIGGLAVGTIITGGLVGAVASGAIAVGAGAAAATAGVSLSTAVGGGILAASAVGGARLIQTRHKRWEDKLMSGLARYSTLERSLEEQLAKEHDPKLKAQLQREMKELLEEKFDFMDKYMVKIQKRKTTLLSHRGMRSGNEYDKLVSGANKFLKNNLPSLAREEKQRRKERECEDLMNVCFGFIGRSYDKAAKLGIDMLGGSSGKDVSKRFQRTRQAFVSDQQRGVEAGMITKGTEANFDSRYDSAEALQNYLTDPIDRMGRVSRALNDSGFHSSIGELTNSFTKGSKIGQQVFESYPLECVLDMVNQGYNIKNVPKEQADKDFDTLTGLVANYVATGRFNSLSQAQKQAVFKMYNNKEDFFDASVKNKIADQLDEVKDEKLKENIQKTVESFEEEAKTTGERDKEVAQVRDGREISSLDIEIAKAGKEAKGWHKPAVQAFNKGVKAFVEEEGIEDSEKSEREKQVYFLADILKAVQGGMDLSNLSKNEQKYIRENLGSNQQLLKLADKVLATESKASGDAEKEKSNKQASEALSNIMSEGKSATPRGELPLL